MKAIILASFAFFFLSHSAFAQKVTLLCTGTMRTPGMERIPATESMTIDYGKRTVDGLIGAPYPIVTLSETKIEFSQTWRTQNQTPMAGNGTIDRVSGAATLWVKEQSGTEPFWIFYSFGCRPAKSAF